jgi:hypothetical protein
LDKSNVVNSFGKHDEAIKSDGHAGTGWQSVIHCREKCAVERHGVKTLVSS